MKVRDLKKAIEDIDDDLEVTFADYDDDSDGEILFQKADGCETLKVNNKTLAVIYSQVYYKLASDAKA